MIQKDHKTYALSTGREIKANWGIIGLSTDGVLTEGYDGRLLGHLGDSDDYDPADWTAAERAELADFMIARWTEFKALQEP